MPRARASYDTVAMKWKDQRLSSCRGKSHPSEECLARFTSATSCQLHSVSFAIGEGAITAIWLVRRGLAAYQALSFLA